MPTILDTARRAGRRRYLSLLVLAAALAACAGTGTKNDRGGSDVYRSEDSYVRLEPIEPGATANSHPAAVSAGQLRRLLAPVEVSDAAVIGKAPVFSQEELETIVPPLASALSKAGPQQDVTFAVAGRRGVFGRLSAKSVTTGRLFASADSLNLIFGLIQQRVDAAMLDYSEVIPEIIPGTRSRRIDLKVGRIEPGSGRLLERRGDWLVFDRAAIPAAAAVPAARSARDTDAKSGGEAPPAPTLESKAQEIENKLRVLEALRERGVVTEQEYRERRRAILEQL